MQHLETAIRDYAERLERAHPDLTPDEIISKRMVVGTDQTGRGERPVRRSVAISVAAAIALVVGVLPLAYWASDGTPSTDPAVFDGLDGRIVYLEAGELIGVDPADPDSRVAVPIADPTEWLSVDEELLPGSQAAQGLAPAGWSSDGSLLALESEHFGERYVMDATGTVTRIPTENVEGLTWGCCRFVTSHWLSPDGSTAAIPSQGHLALLDLATGRVEGTIEFDLGPDDSVTGPAWSPDGSEIAFIAHRSEGEITQPSVYVGDVAGGTSRQLTGPFAFGYIRQVSWSPDGQQLLLVASQSYLSAPGTELSNPLAGPLRAGLYVVDADWTRRTFLADGHFVSAAWSPDGSRIAALDHSPSGRTLVLMSADGTERRSLVEVPDLFWTPPPNDVVWYPGS